MGSDLPFAAYLDVRFVDQAMGLSLAVISFGIASKYVYCNLNKKIPKWKKYDTMSSNKNPIVDVGL